MKSLNLMCIQAFVFLAVLAIAVGLAAQDNPGQNDNHKLHHYKLIDLGTFGGPTGYLCNDPSNGGGACAVLNSRGTVVSGADTSMPDPNYPNVCLTCPLDPYILHAFQWQDGTLHDLGALPGVNSSSANSISPNGLVAGFSENGAIDPLLGVPEVDAVLWKDGEIVNLGTIEGGYESNAFAVNDRGQVTGAFLNTIPDPFSFFGLQLRAFLWQNGVMKDLGTLGTGTDAVAYFINEHGQVAGTSFTNTTPNPVTGFPPQDPFLWENGTMRDLGTLGGNFGLPNALNNKGQVVGSSDIAGDLNAHAFLWDKGVMTDLGTLVGASPPSSTASWINDTGEIVGGSYTPTAFHAFLWRRGVMTDLGTVGNDACSGSLGLNSETQVVGFSSIDCAVNAHAFLWEDGQIIDLNIFNYPGSGLDQLLLAYNINDSGEIDGLGVPPGVDPGDVFTLGHVFVLIPCDEAHPGVDGCDYSMIDASRLPQASASPGVSSRTSGQPFQSPRAPFPFRNRVLGRPLLKIGFAGEGEAGRRTESPQAPIVVFQPTSLNFGTVQDGQTKTLTTTLTNTGTATLIISSIRITGSNPANFFQTNTCGTQVLAGKSCVITVTFRPGGIHTEQGFSADVSVSDNAGGSPQQVPLSGIGERGGGVGYCVVNSQTHELNGSCIGPGFNMQCQSKYNSQQCPVGAKAERETNLTCGLNVVRVDAARSCTD